MKKMGISEKEDREWHKKQELSRARLKKSKQKSVNPFAIGGGFLNYCVKREWLIRKENGKKARYYLTKKGKKEIRKFGIKI